MTVQVRYLSMLAQVTGRFTEEFHVLEHVTVAQLLKLVARTHGESMRRLLYSDDGAIMVSVLRNGVSVPCETELIDGDEITLMVLLSGG